MRIKKIVMVGISIALIILLMCLAIVFFTKREIKYNNIVSIDDCIKNKYSKNEIEYLIEEIKKDTVDFQYIKSKFEVECVRKTYQGYYIVLINEADEKLFMFFDDNLKVSNYCMIEKNLVLEDFDFIQLNITSKTQIMDYDKNFIKASPFSSDATTKHIIAEGILIVSYDQETDLVKSVELVTNQKLSLEESNYSNSFMPYILSMISERRQM